MRLIDGDKLLARYKERCEGCKETKNYCEHCCDLADVIDDIEDAPTIDIVTCKECMNSEELIDGSCLCLIHDLPYGADYFCASGQRKEKTDGEIC